MSVSKSLKGHFSVVLTLLGDSNDETFSSEYDFHPGRDRIFLSSNQSITDDQLVSFLDVLRVFVPRNGPDFPQLHKHDTGRSFYLLTSSSRYAMEPFFRLLYYIRFAYLPSMWSESRCGTAFIFFGPRGSGKMHIIDQMKNRFKPGKKWMDRLQREDGIESEQIFSAKALIHKIVCFAKLDIEFIQCYIDRLRVYSRLNFAILIHNEKDLSTTIEMLRFSKRIFVISCRRNMEFG